MVVLPVNLNDAPARQAADTKRHVQADGAGRDMIHVHGNILAQAHNRALAVRLFQLAEYLGERLLFIVRRFDTRQRLFFLCHSSVIPPSPPQPGRGQSQMNILTPAARGAGADHALDA